MCALERELSLEARMKAAGVPMEDNIGGTAAGEKPSGATLAQTRRQTTDGGGGGHDGE